MAPSGFERNGHREAEGTGLGLGPSKGLVLVDENNHEPYDEEHEHRGADEVIVALNAKGRQVQFGRASRLLIISLTRPGCVCSSVLNARII